MVYSYILIKKGKEMPYILKLISILQGLNINNP